MGSWEESYVGQLRKFWGNRTLIVPGARAVIQNDAGHILLIKRSDNGMWALPAGSIELGDSIYDCLVREVKEETGLDVISATAIAVYTEPRFTFTNAFDQEHQMFTMVFRVDEWSGTLVTETDETADARFFPPDNLPDIPELYRETLTDVKRFDGTFMVK